MTSRMKCIDRNEQNQAVRILLGATVQFECISFLEYLKFPTPSEYLSVPVILGLVKADTDSSDQR